jgi:hypothetical protein
MHLPGQADNTSKLHILNGTAVTVELQARQ